MRRSQDFDDFTARGGALAAERPARFGELLAARTADEVATVAFTSGTTGVGRGFLLSQAGEVGLARLVAARIGLREQDQGYSLLPLAHATPRLFDAYAPLVVGSTLSFSESLETVPTDLVEASPTILAATPRLLERVRGDVELRIGPRRQVQAPVVPLGDGPDARGDGSAQRRTPGCEPSGPGSAVASSPAP